MENENVKFCVVCGRRIPQLSLRKVTCSEFCRARKKCGYAPYINYTKPPFDDLTMLQQKAHRAGMSYGKYVALTEGKEVKRSNADNRSVSVLQ